MIRRNAFSLLEMMVVIAIIGFLAGILVVNVIKQQEDAAVATTIATMEQLSSALKIYKVKNKKYPSSDDGLDALIQSKDLDKLPLDAWGNEIFYQFPGSDDNPFDLWSLGADGLDGGEGNNADLYFHKQP